MKIYSLVTDAQYDYVFYIYHLGGSESGRGLKCCVVDDKAQTERRYS